MRRRSRPQGRLPGLEPLEPRVLLSGFTAYNDTVSGPRTNANTTLYADNGGTSAGQLKDIATGAYTPVLLTAVNVGVSFATSGANPAAGTDAANIFGAYVDFTSASGPNDIQCVGTRSYTYHFENLDPGGVYEFAGTAVHGNASYTDRWTLVTLLGADSFTAAHSTGVGIVTAGLAPNQVALWTGANHLAGQGFVVQWKNIDPGDDGEVEIVSQQYTGAIPTSVDAAGIADGILGYALNGIRLIEKAPTAPPTLVNTPASDIAAFSASIGGQIVTTGGQAPSTRIYFGDNDGGTVAANWDAWIDLGPQAGDFSGLIGNLSQARTYYYRAFAENSVGAAWAPATASFTTLTVTAPSVINLAAANVGMYSARVHGQVTGAGNDAPVVKVYYGDNDSGTNPAGWDHSIDLGVQSGEFYGTIDQLNPATTYYFAAYARNAAGEAWATPSLSFGTLAPLPLEITEFMADNSTTLSTRTRASTAVPFAGDYTYPDWIEIHNPTDAAAVLGGFYLTDDLGTPTQWSFPAGASIAAGGYLVVFASGDSIRDPALDERGYLHTNFKLKAGGGDVALVNASGAVVSAFAAYPSQSRNISYGLGADGQKRFFPVPTPGWDNANDVPQVPRFSVAGTTFTSSVVVNLTAGYPTDVIHYTLDETAPTAASPVWSGAKTLTTTTMVRAVSIGVNGKSSGAASETYIALGADVLASSSNLPIVVVETFGDGVPGVGTVFGDSYIGFFEPGADGRARLTNAVTLGTRGGLHVRGSSSAGFAKKQYRVELWDEKDQDKALSVLGMPDDADWIFYGPTTYDRVLISNPFIYDLSNQIGCYAVRTQWVEMYLDANGGQVTASDYVGVYAIMEVIESGDDRVDVEPLSTGAGGVPVQGGFIWKNDRGSPYVEPELPNAAQQTYINSWINGLEAAANGANFRDPVLGYAAWADVGSFVDHNLLNMLAMNVDAMRLSGYYYKTAAGKIEAGPIWDFDRALESTDGRDDNPLAWNGTGDSTLFFTDTRVRGWWPRMFQDPDFVQKYIDRWFELRKNQFSLANIFAAIDAQAVQLQEAAPRDYARWSGSRYGTFAGEVQHLKTWLTSRINWIDSQWIGGPTFSLPGPVVTPGATVTLWAPAGSVYYTLDGTDPRAVGGGLSPSAHLASGPITITQYTRITARVYRAGYVPSAGAPGYVSTGDDWSAPATSEYFVHPLAAAGNVVVTEIQYHPLGPTPEELATQPPADPDFADHDFEFIEIQNISATVLSLSDMTFTSGVTFTFPNMTLPADGYVIIVSNLPAFQARYDTAGMTIAGQYSGHLNNAGDTLVLVDRAGQPIQSFTYSPDWYPASDGLGYSLNIRNPLGALALWDVKEGWGLSNALGGSPGTDNSGLTAGSIAVNELLAHTDLPAGDWVELKNTTADPIDVGGWWLSDDRLNLTKYRMAPNTIIQPGHYLLLTERDNFGNPADPGCVTPFAFSEHGETVWLVSADADGNLLGYRETYDFEGSDREVPFARYVTSTGGVDFVAESASTPGADNAYPQVGPVVINEVMYHPLNDTDEFVELHNITGASVPLYDPARPANTWKISGGITYTFASGLLIPAGGYLLVVNTDAAAFRTKYGVPPDVPIVGPYTGLLDNAGDNVKLYRPGEPDPLPPYTTSDYLVDRVEYDDAAPWPTQADGGGPSLQRLFATDYGNDVVNWDVGPNGGTPGRANGSDDVTPPRLADVSTQDGDATHVTIVFDEVMDPVSSRTAANYAITNVTVLGVAAGADNRTVVLTTSTLVEGVLYTLTVNHVKDLAGNEILADSRRTFVYFQVGTGLWGQYYQYTPGNINWATVKLARLDPAVDFDWGSNSPDATISSDYFSVRWSGKIKGLYSETYTFYAWSDEGVRLWINGQLIIDDWTPHAAVEDSGTFTMVVGTRYDIKMEYYDGTGAAAARLSWSSPHTAKQVVPTSLLFNVAVPAVTQADSYVTPAGVVLDVAAPGVLANDLDPNGLPLTAVRRLRTTHGTVTLGSDGSFTYTPTAGYEGSDSFTYYANNGWMNSVETTVSLVVDRPVCVSGVMVNGVAGRTVSGIDPSGGGVQSVQVTFSKAVTFAPEDVVVEAVTFNGNAETAVALVPLSVSGSGSSVMTISLAAGVVVDTWVKVTLKGSGTLQGAAGAHYRLDGEAKAGGSGRSYVYAASDLPSGDGTEGGDAVFYVGSLRGDFASVGGAPAPDGQVTDDDVGGFLTKFQAGDKDADFRGAGFGPSGPDGQVTPFDFDGFMSVYQQAVAEGRRLAVLPDPGPQGGGDAGPLSAGDPGPLAAGDPAPVAPVVMADASSPPAAALFEPAAVDVGRGNAAALFEPAAVMYEPAAVMYEPAAVLYEPAAVLYEPAAVLYEPAAEAAGDLQLASPAASAAGSGPAGSGLSGSGLAGAGETQSGDAQPAPVPLAYASDVPASAADPVLQDDGGVDLLALAEVGLPLV